MAHSQAGREPVAWSREEAFRHCERMARSHYENFTVGSRLLPREIRRHVYAIYGYCRSVDDLGDEATASQDPRRLDEADHRLALLDWWQSELEACYSGAPSHPVMVALQETIETFDIPAGPFLKLIRANRMDQTAKRYPAYTDLLHYCDHSANPVGQLFLYLFGYRDAERLRLADATCTALQLTNFWQDVTRDYLKGRIYLPLEDLAGFGYTETQLARGEVNDSFRRLMAFEVDRTMELFRDGSALVGTLKGPVKVDVALFTRGGTAVLEAIRRRNYDVLTERPSLSRARKAAIFLSTWLTSSLGLGNWPGGSRRGRSSRARAGSPPGRGEDVD